MPDHDHDHEQEQEQEHDEGYAGPATLTVDGRDVAVRAILDARHEPHDGRLHWFGRVAMDGDAAAVVARAGRVVLSTEGGRAEARIGDVDPWGRYRVTGVGPPPFRINEPDLHD